MKKYCILGADTLKLIAAFAMLLDHIGVVLFPEVTWLRIVGRSSFPIFAFMLARGCFYTKNKTKYFLRVFLLGVACQLVYGLYSDDALLGILLSFSMAIPMLYLLQEIRAGKKYARLMLFVSVAVCWLVCRAFEVDYGFWGCMLPVFAGIFPPEQRYRCLAMLGIGLVLLSLSIGGMQWYALFALGLLLFSSDAGGTRGMKYFFYIFYPAHLLALEGISLLLQR